MNPDQLSFIFHFEKQQDKYLYCPALFKNILRGKRVSHVLRRENASSYFASLRDGTERADSTIGGVVDNPNAQDFVCSVIPTGLGDATFACVNAHQNHLCRM